MAMAMPMPMKFSSKCHRIDENDEHYELILSRFRVSTLFSDQDIKPLPPNPDTALISRTFPRTPRRGKIQPTTPNVRLTHHPSTRQRKRQQQQANSTTTEIRASHVSFFSVVAVAVAVAVFVPSLSSSIAVSFSSSLMLRLCVRLYCMYITSW